MTTSRISEAFTAGIGAFVALWSTADYAAGRAAAHAAGIAVGWWIGGTIWRLACALWRRRFPKPLESRVHITGEWTPERDRELAAALKRVQRRGLA